MPSLRHNEPTGVGKPASQTSSKVLTGGKKHTEAGPLPLCSPTLGADSAELYLRCMLGIAARQEQLKQQNSSWSWCQRTIRYDVFEPCGQTIGGGLPAVTATHTRAIITWAHSRKGAGLHSVQGSTHMAARRALNLQAGSMHEGGRGTGLCRISRSDRA